MDLIEQKIRQKATQYTKSLLEQALKNEPEITADLQKIALEVSAEMVGLEHKFKTEESLTRKLADKINADLANLLNSGFSKNEAIESSISLRAKQNNDAVRYTFLFPDEKYVFAFRKALTSLAKQNYKVPEKRIWNAWKNIGTAFDNGYRGINITVISSQGQTFELQFHTKESFDLKTKNHKLYKQLKSNTISTQRKEEIKAELVKMARTVQLPIGVKKL